MTGKQDLKGYFCPAPWENAVVQVQGGLHLCSCSAWIPDPVGSLRDDAWEDVWNGPRAQAVRESILDGSFRYCDHHVCPHLNAPTGKVQKTESVTDPEHRRIIENRETKARRGPKSIQLAYDSSCNLVCPSCRLEHIVMRGEPFEDAKRIHERVMTHGVRDAERLEFSGQGETFASRIYLDVLRNFDFKANPNAQFHLITNGTLLTPKMWDSIANSHHAIDIIHVSINAGTPETFAINQQGGDWDVLMRNLRFMSELRRSGGFKHLMFGYYVQANNFREMPGLVQLAKELGVDHVQFQTMLNWGTYTEEAFAAVAVHQPTHPEHREFLEVLQHRALQDPIVSLGNLTQYLPTAAGKRPAPDRWQDFAETLSLSDSQAAEIRAHLADYRDAFLALTQQPPADDGVPPLEVFVRALASAGQGGGARQQAASDRFVHYMTQATEGASGRPYHNLANKLAARCRGNIIAALDETQLQRFLSFTPDSVLEIDIDYDPLGVRVEKMVGSREGDPGASAPPDEGSIIDFDDLCERLSLADGQRDRIRGILDEAKDARARIFNMDSADGGPSPALFLAKQLRVASAFVPKVNRRLSLFLNSACLPDSRLTYAAGFAEVQEQLVAALEAALTAEQCEKLRTIPPCALLEVSTGHDPVGAAVAVCSRAIPPDADPVPQNWNELAAWLCLEPDPWQKALEVVRRLKESYATLCQQPQGDGGQPPLAKLAAGVREHPREAQKQFVRELQQGRLASGTTYLAAIRELEDGARANLLDLLDEAQREEFLAWKPFSLLHLPLSDEPFQAALQALLRAQPTNARVAAMP